MNTTDSMFLNRLSMLTSSISDMIIKAICRIFFVQSTHILISVDLCYNASYTNILIFLVSLNQRFYWVNQAFPKSKIIISINNNMFNHVRINKVRKECIYRFGSNTTVFKNAFKCGDRFMFSLFGELLDSHLLVKFFQC